MKKKMLVNWGSIKSGTLLVLFPDNESGLPTATYIGDGEVIHDGRLKNLSEIEPNIMIVKTSREVKAEREKIGDELYYVESQKIFHEKKKRNAVSEVKKTFANKGGGTPYAI